MPTECPRRRAIFKSQNARKQLFFNVIWHYFPKALSGLHCQVFVFNKLSPSQPLIDRNWRVLCDHRLGDEARRRGAENDACKKASLCPTNRPSSTCDFLQWILEAVEEETIHVVVDRHTIHPAAAVDAFLQSEGARIQLHLLPAYSPELNPYELVWSVVKRKAGQQLIQTNEELKIQLMTALQELKDCPNKGLFEEPDCQHILK